MLYPLFTRTSPRNDDGRCAAAHASHRVVRRALGLLVTLTSVGAGAIGVTVLAALYPMLPAKRLVGSDIAHAVPLTLLGGLGHFGLGNVDTGLLLALLMRVDPRHPAGRAARRACAGTAAPADPGDTLCYAAWALFNKG